MNYSMIHDSSLIALGSHETLSLVRTLGLMETFGSYETLSLMRAFGSYEDSGSYEVPLTNDTRGTERCH